jgi:pimeloyl-ACP methyl ester carboxylesterase
MEAAPVVTTHSAELRVPRTRTGTIETVDVPDDRKVLVVLGANTKRPIVHFHGMCAEAKSDLDAFAASVSEHGTVVALEGDAPCPRGQGGGASWSTDVAAIDRRVDAALKAVSDARGIALDPGEVVLVGESLGATRVTALASRFPEKYKRLVLVGGPETPSAKQLGSATAIALLAGEKEPQEKMRQGTLGLENAGVTARFWEMADATHGNYGTDGARRMSEAVAFVTSK